VNTLASKSTSKTDLLKGSQIIYSKLQKEIAKITLSNDEKKKNGETIIDIKLDNQTCPKNNYFYELKDKELTFKYCKGDSSFSIYQESPVYTEDTDDLAFIKSTIGARAYAKKNGKWFEYYYQGDVDIPWVPVESGSILNSQDEEQDIEDRIISYIPDAKDLIIRSNGGCMLANGDIFCWGNNTNKKSGIESYGQLNPTLSPDYINTPVMLRVQIDNTTKVTDDSGKEFTRRDKKWYNNPYRIKFEKMAVNSTNVCGISPIFDYFQSGTYKKFGGDLYCNGKLLKAKFEDIGSSNPSEITTSILKRNKFFARDKDDRTNDSNESEIYLRDVAMVDGAIAVISDEGKIYVSGKNDKGILGINSSDESLIKYDPVEVTNSNGSLFKEVYALRETKTFAALDENNNFWIWGERHDDKKLVKPTLISSKKFDPNGVFINSKDFVLRGLDKYFYRTYNTSSLKKLNIPTTALSVTLNNKSNVDEFLYVDENRQLQGNINFKSCKKSNFTDCSSSDSEVFNLAFNKLNELLPASNNKEYATFSNIAILGISEVSSAPDKFTTIVEDFESGRNGWSSSYSRSYGTKATNFLGRFGSYQSIEKTYNFGSEYKNRKVRVEFDVYEIDSWNSGQDYFYITINNKTVKTESYESTTVNSSNLLHPLASTYNNSYRIYYNQDEKHSYSYEAYLDNSGRLKLEFESALNQNLDNESWGIDNIKITDLYSAPTSNSSVLVCAMTGLGSKSQMYCWGNAKRSLPIINTSLYDLSKVSTMNELFVTPKANVNKQMSFDHYNNSGNLFLKYPTYIGGFDYEFYFK